MTTHFGFAACGGRARCRSTSPGTKRARALAWCLIPVRSKGDNIVKARTATVCAQASQFDRPPAKDLGIKYGKLSDDELELLEQRAKVLSAG
jgi:hypothetical protein